ncbi:hypothetical protein B0H14DRAFT_2400095 [Mycena olivaceomarginata]|nr:hypothetical protein B0H14DRAFT_2400095 [Mycena olivaceomarginata]
MCLIECRRTLLHHIISGSCADYAVYASPNPRPQRTACRCISSDFLSAVDISQAVLDIILNATSKEISTEHLTHIAAALNIVVVDLESTWGTESPYVMLSRAKSLDGVFILRPFRQKIIQCRPREDVRK